MNAAPKPCDLEGGALNGNLSRSEDDRPRLKQVRPVSVRPKPSGCALPFVARPVKGGEGIDALTDLRVLGHRLDQCLAYVVAVAHRVPGRAPQATIDLFDQGAEELHLVLHHLLLNGIERVLSSTHG
jgi:hypothetical protein